MDFTPHICTASSNSGRQRRSPRHLIARGSGSSWAKRILHSCTLADIALYIKPNIGEFDVFLYLPPKMLLMTLGSGSKDILRLCSIPSTGRSDIKIHDPSRTLIVGWRCGFPISAYAIQEVVKLEQPYSKAHSRWGISAHTTTRLGALFGTLYSFRCNCCGYSLFPVTLVHVGRKLQNSLRRHQSNLKNCTHFS